MSEEAKGDEKEIIVDEGWKSRIQAEKEAARNERESPQRSESTSSADQAGPLPPPSLTVLASSLYLQGMITLGLLPSPGSDKPEVHLDHAKHSVDMLQMLHEKTQGNCTPEETKELDTMLHELRMAYLTVQQQGGKHE